MKVRTWEQLLQDPRVAEVWSEDNDGVDYWVALKWPWVDRDGCGTIHEWSKKACIECLNSSEKSNEVPK